MNASPLNADPAELAKFAALAQSWWDPKGPSSRCTISIRCGSSMSSASRNSPALRSWTSAAAAESCPSPWRAPARGCSASIYRKRCWTWRDCMRSRRRWPCNTGWSRGGSRAGAPRRIRSRTCMEMLEHVPDPAASMRALAALTRHGGDIIVSTLNRNPWPSRRHRGREYIARFCREARMNT